MDAGPHPNNATYHQGKSLGFERRTGGGGGGEETGEEKGEQGRRRDRRGKEEEEGRRTYLGMVALRKLLQRGQTGVSYLRNLHVLENLQNRTRRTHSSCITL